MADILNTASARSTYNLLISMSRILACFVFRLEIHPYMEVVNTEPTTTIYTYKFGDCMARCLDTSNCKLFTYDMFICKLYATQDVTLTKDGTFTFKRICSSGKLRLIIHLTGNQISVRFTFYDNKTPKIRKQTLSKVLFSLNLTSTTLRRDIWSVRCRI